MWYHGSGVVLDCIDSRFLLPFFTLILFANKISLSFLILQNDDTDKPFVHLWIFPYRLIQFPNCDCPFYMLGGHRLTISNLCCITVLSAKSDSDALFCLQIYQGLIICRPLVY